MIIMERLVVPYCVEVFILVFATRWANDDQFVHAGKVCCAFGPLEGPLFVCAIKTVEGEASAWAHTVVRKAAPVRRQLDRCETSRSLKQKLA